MVVTRTYTIKLKPTKSQQRQLNQYFYEAKVLYNYLLSCSNIFAVNSCKIKHPWKYDKDRNKVKVELNSLPSKLKQNVHRQILNSIESLSAVKHIGRKVGRLKFKSEIRTIEIDNQSFSVKDPKHVKLAGFGRKSIRCLGLNQLDNHTKLRNVKLMKIDDEFLLKICILKEVEDHEVCNQNIGIDFGIADNITLSNGEKLNCKIPESKKLKKIQKKFARSYLINNKITNNGRKLQKKLHKEYQHITNQKKDFTSKLINYLDTSFDYICFQDEQIQGWRNLNGNKRTIQHSCLGSIKNKLVEKYQEQPERYIMLSKWLPTTQYCPRCHKKNKHTLEERTYHCSCGYTEDRDIHAAKNMLIFANL